ncbi:hypothetical protein MOUN0_B03070 [Monosporozyma unispora]|nr:protein with role in RNA processing [Kazachstania unispora]
MSISLEYIVGFRVKVTNLIDVVTEGRIYAFNSGNNTITLQTNKKNQSPYDFKIIKCSFIKSLEVIGDKPNANSFKKQFMKPSLVNLDRVEDFLEKQIEVSNKNSLLKGKGVSHEGQAIFDLIYKTIPDTKWVGKDIVILDDIKVTPPYKVANIVTIHETQSVDLIERIVERGWANIDSETYAFDDGRKGG